MYIVSALSWRLSAEKIRALLKRPYFKYFWTSEEVGTAPLNSMQHNEGPSENNRKIIHDFKEFAHIKNP